jgi:hypothetical protein
MEIDYTIEDAPKSTPRDHELLPFIDQLIEVGPEKVAVTQHDSEEDAVKFLHAAQAAAKQRNKSAVKRGLNKEGKKYVLKIAVREKITRNRKPAEDTLTDGGAPE